MCSKCRTLKTSSGTVSILVHISYKFQLGHNYAQFQIVCFTRYLLQFKLYVVHTFLNSNRRNRRYLALFSPGAINLSVYMSIYISFYLSSFHYNLTIYLSICITINSSIFLSIYCIQIYKWHSGMIIFVLSSIPGTLNWKVLMLR